MKQKSLIVILSVVAIIVLVLVLVVATSGKNRKISSPQEDLNANLQLGMASVSEIEVAIMESFPVQVAVTAYGELPDGCTTIHGVQSERIGNVFTVIVETERPRDAVCTQALVPFEETFSLDVRNLLAGEYAVNVNGVEAFFTLSVDNTVDFDAGEK